MKCGRKPYKFCVSDLVVCWLPASFPALPCSTFLGTAFTRFLFSKWRNMWKLQGRRRETPACSPFLQRCLPQGLSLHADSRPTGEHFPLWFGRPTTAPEWVQLLLNGCGSDVPLVLVALTVVTQLWDAPKLLCASSALLQPGFTNPYIKSLPFVFLLESC